MSSEVADISEPRSLGARRVSDTATGLLPRSGQSD